MEDISILKNVGFYSCLYYSIFIASYEEYGIKAKPLIKWRVTHIPWAKCLHINSTNKRMDMIMTPIPLMFRFFESQLKFLFDKDTSGKF